MALPMGSFRFRENENTLCFTRPYRQRGGQLTKKQIPIDGIVDRKNKNFFRR